DECFSARRIARIAEDRHGDLAGKLTSNGQVLIVDRSGETAEHSRCVTGESYRAVKAGKIAAPGGQFTAGQSYCIGDRDIAKRNTRTRSHLNRARPRPSGVPNFERP